MHLSTTLFASFVKRGRSEYCFGTSASEPLVTFKHSHNGHIMLIPCQRNTRTVRRSVLFFRLLLQPLQSLLLFLRLALDLLSNARCLSLISHGACTWKILHHCFVLFAERTFNARWHVNTKIRLAILLSDGFYTNNVVLKRHFPSVCNSEITLFLFRLATRSLSF